MYSVLMVLTTFWWEGVVSRIGFSSQPSSDDCQQGLTNDDSSQNLHDVVVCCEYRNAFLSVIEETNKMVIRGSAMSWSECQECVELPPPHTALLTLLVSCPYVFCIRFPKTDAVPPNQPGKRLYSASGCVPALVWPSLGWWYPCPYISQVTWSTQLWVNSKVYNPFLIAPSESLWFIKAHSKCRTKIMTCRQIMDII